MVPVGRICFVASCAAVVALDLALSPAARAPTPPERAPREATVGVIVGTATEAASPAPLVGAPAPTRAPRRSAPIARPRSSARPLPEGEVGEW